MVTEPKPMRALPEDERVMARLVAVADAVFGGHLTILKFTTNWRVGFGTPHAGDAYEFRELVRAMAVGPTLAEAGRAALARVSDILDGAGIGAPVGDDDVGGSSRDRARRHR